MLKYGILGALLVMLVAPAQAADYVFNCRNEWTQDVLITVEADSVGAARKELKTNKKYLDKYSLDARSLCVFRTELKSKRKAKAVPKAEDKSTSVETE